MRFQILALKSKKLLTGGLLLSLLAASILGWAVLAQSEQPEPALGSPIHPVFALLDESGENVLTTGAPVSTMKTCGACHDTGFIAANSEHAQLGLDPLPMPGQTAAEQASPAAPGPGAEMNCFLCHTSRPDNAARLAELETGDPAWASTATLLKSGIVTGGKGQYSYAAGAFDEQGNLRSDWIGIQDPGSQNCGQCHGTVHTDLSEPFVRLGYAPAEWRAATTGQVISPEKLSDSAMNLSGKEGLARTWDVHAERAVTCTDCHFSLNNPVYYQENSGTRPEHLSFDPRRLELGEYLKQPVHQFARGASRTTGDAAMADADPALENSMRRCDGCHSIQTTHSWLPYKEAHMEAVSCESCHIPQMYSAALEQVDWTALHTDGSPRQVYRGVEGDIHSLGSLVIGYQPVLRLRENVGGKTQVAPFNLVTAWYWVSGEPAQPIAQANLQAAWLENGAYPPEILSAFDANGDGALDDGELALDSDAKVELISGRLAGLGLQNPRIRGEVQPYSINHGVAAGDWAIKDCKTCHSQDSRLAAPMLLAGETPGGSLPGLPGGDSAGKVVRGSDGAVYYQPATEAADLYVFGHNRVGWIDLLGSLFFIGTLLGVAGHGTYRTLSALRMPRHTPALKKVYMYGVYERLWHWLQTFTVLGLLFTGLVIHKPDTFGIFSFRGVVLVHNVLAGILLANAALSLFYHLASGEIRQFIPRPAGFFDQAVQQGIFYLRGTFRGEPHPFEKTREKKLNPLQQATYFGLLNVLLPLQVITGALMWGVQRWPDLTARLGGLPFLAPFHSLIAWLFAAFIVGHVYLTTTGHTPLAGIEAMMVGWDEVESSSSSEYSSADAPASAEASAPADA